MGLLVPGPLCRLLKGALLKQPELRPWMVTPLGPSAGVPDKVSLGQAICPQLIPFCTDIINYVCICLYDRKPSGNLEGLTDWIYFSYFCLTIWLCLYKVIIFESVIHMYFKVYD